MGGITHLPKRFVLIAWLIGLCMMVNVLSPDSVAQELRPARLYFIRQSTFVGIINSPDVSVDGRLIGSIATGSHLVVDVRQGATRSPCLIGRTLVVSSSPTWR